MPEKCVFCDEVAVIVDTVDGGKDQLICIECGTLADADKTTGDEQDQGGEILGGDQPTSAYAAIECVSCGVEVVTGNVSSTSTSSSLKRQDLCTDCVELEEEEEFGESCQTTYDGKNDALRVNKEQTDLDPCSNNSSGNLHHAETGLCESESKCTSCGGGDLIVDSVNGDDRLVCTSCGQVNSGAILTVDSSCADGMGTSSAQYHSVTLPTFSHREKLQEGLVVGITEIRNLCSKFCFPPDIKSEAENLYRNVYRHPKIVNRMNKKKQSVAAVCLFIVCRRFDLPISVTQFKDDVTNYPLFLQMKKFLGKNLGLRFPHVSVTEHLTEVLADLKFDQQLTKKVKNILFLFRKAWLMEGKNRRVLITFAAYFAFISSNRCAKYITIRDFFLQNQPPCTISWKSSRKIANECQYMLCKLASSLPWVDSKEITPKTLPRYIDSILQYRESLFHLVFRPEEENLIQTVTCSSSAQAPTIPCPSLDEEVPGSSDNGYGRTMTGEEEKKPLVLHSQKERLLPPCAKRIKTEPGVQDRYCSVPSNVNLDSPDLRESEFEDEISSYILSPEERESVRECKMNIFLNVKSEKE